jgi:hypothetical protein
MKLIVIVSYFAIIISGVLTLDYFLPKNEKEDLVLSRETVGGRDSASRRNTNNLVRIIETLSSSFTSAEETEQCCIYAGDVIFLKKTFLLGIPFSYRLKNDNHKTEYFPVMSYFYLENMGNYFLLVFAILSLKAKVIEHRLVFFTLGMFLLFTHSFFFLFYY